MCNNFTYFAIKNHYKMSYSRVWKWWEHLFSLGFKTDVLAMLYHQFIDVFVRGRQPALPSFYFHYSENFIVLMVVRAFDSSRSCGLACCYDHLLMKHIPVSQIQPQITGDLVVARVFLKVSLWKISLKHLWQRHISFKYSTKIINTQIILWCYVWLRIYEDHIIKIIQLIVLFTINLFTYLFIFLFIHHSFIFLSV